jgi:hypothetical protein
VKEQEEKQIINVYGIANIGCTMEHVTFQTLVQGETAEERGEEEVAVERVEEPAEEDMTLEKEPREEPNYFAPQKNLCVFLCQAWFDEVSSDPKKYTPKWREKMTEALMNTAYKDDIAAEWANVAKRNQIKCEIVGGLIDAGVIISSYNAISSRLDIKEVKSESLARYMSNAKKRPYYDWLLEYVKQ